MYLILMLWKADMVIFIHVELESHALDLVLLRNKEEEESRKKEKKEKK